MRYVVVTAATEPALYRSRTYQERRWVDAGLWPAFVQESDASVYASRIDQLFPALQLVAVGQSASAPRQVVGVAHAVPVALTDGAPLPDAGWEWGVRSAIEGYERGMTANALCGLSVTVDHGHQRQGVATKLLVELREAARRLGLPRFVVPVRPLVAVSLEKIATLRRPDGTHVDPWIRTHERLGGEIVGICHRSMTITAPVDRWREWGATFDVESGTGIVPGGLVPLRVTGSAATYVEPNVWMQYSLGGFNER